MRLVHNLGKAGSLLLAALLSVTLVAGCASDTGESAGVAAECAGKKQVTVGIVMRASSSSYWVSYQAGAQKEADSDGCVQTVAVAPSGEDDATDQINIVESMITRGVDALIIATISDQLLPVIKRADAEGIKIVLADHDLNGAPRATLVSPNTQSAAQDGAAFLLSRTGDKAKIGIITAPGIPVVEERVAAAKALFEDRGATVVATLSGGTCDRLVGENSAMDLLLANSDVKGIYAACGKPALGAVQAVKRSNLTPNKDVFVVGFDGLPEEFTAIKEGFLTGTVDQQPFAQGEEAMGAALTAARGGEVPPKIDSPHLVVNSENVDQLLESVSGSTSPSSAASPSGK